jgi:hypothetical protein
MNQYQVVSTKGKIVFTGSIDEIANEFEIELDRKLEYGLFLHLEEKNDVVIIALHTDNILPHHQVLKMFNTYLQTTDITQVTTEIILTTLGVSKLLPYSQPVTN